MQFQKGYIYHIYNQGNNRQKIFFNRDNYLYFLQKMKIYISPYADILAWCLMPNHFHWMVYVRNIEVFIDERGEALLTKGFASSERREIQQTKGFASSETLGNGKLRTFNASIGLLLRSYTNAINKQEKRSGSLFRKETKAECVNCFKGNTLSFVENTIKIIAPEKQYPQICFDYIHHNPVKANLVKQAVDWEFSSARDYVGLRKGELIDRKRAGEYIDF